MGERCVITNQKQGQEDDDDDDAWCVVGLVMVITDENSK